MNVSRAKPIPVNATPAWILNVRGCVPRSRTSAPAKCPISRRSRGSSPARSNSFCSSMDTERDLVSPAATSTWWWAFMNHSGAALKAATHGPPIGQVPLNAMIARPR